LDFDSLGNLIQNSHRSEYFSRASLLYLLSPIQKFKKNFVSKYFKKIKTKLVFIYNIMTVDVALTNRFFHFFHQPPERLGRSYKIFIQNSVVFRWGSAMESNSWNGSNLVCACAYRYHMRLYVHLGSNIKMMFCLVVNTCPSNDL
jgi:hypothetical protein